MMSPRLPQILHLIHSQPPTLGLRQQPVATEFGFRQCPEEDDKHTFSLERKIQTGHGQYGGASTLHWRKPEQRLLDVNVLPTLFSACKYFNFFVPRWEPDRIAFKFQ